MRRAALAATAALVGTAADAGLLAGQLGERLVALLALFG